MTFVNPITMLKLKVLLDASASNIESALRGSWLFGFVKRL